LNLYIYTVHSVEFADRKTNSATKSKLTSQRLIFYLLMYCRPAKEKVKGVTPF